MKFLEINRYEKSVQPKNHALFWGYFNYEWFTKGHYDVFSKVDGPLGFNKG